MLRCLHLGVLKRFVMWFLWRLFEADIVGVSTSKLHTIKSNSCSSLASPPLRSQTRSSNTCAPVRSHHLPKPTGGHRLLHMMSFLRRLALKAVIAAQRPSSVTAEARSLQHGVRCRDRANKMMKSIQYFAEADASLVLVAFDLEAAFQNISRRATLRSIGQHDPDLATGAPPHTAYQDFSRAQIHARSGIDQGCPLSSCGRRRSIHPPKPTTLDGHPP